MLKIHFLNVGHGDCTIIKHPSGRITIVDVNNSQEYDSGSLNEIVEERFQQRGGPQVSNFFAQMALMLEVRQEVLAEAKYELTDPIEFLRRNYPGEVPFRFVLTHPDLDHMRGLSRLHREIGFTNFWDTRNTKPTPDFRSEADEIDWKYYQWLRQGKGHSTTCIFLHQGAQGFAYNLSEQGVPGGDGIEVLSPTPALVARANQLERSNDLSLVLRIWHARRSILLPGDAEEDAWNGMLAAYGRTLKSDFLKASHHGRDSGYLSEAVAAIDPISAFVSVGKKPDTDASRKYAHHCRRVFSTRYHGNIELQIHDDGSHHYFVDRNADV